jgi:ATP-dependent Clp protease ATP-binding subunit ClpC
VGRDEAKKLLDLDLSLREHVIGQPNAVGAVSKAVRRSRAGFKDPNRPIASFIFAGPTGVGKTELTKVLSKYFCYGESSMVRLDMSEYMEKHSVSKLIGSPPGYIGYGEGGQLTEKVRLQPYNLVLFDEIEKAHPDVFNVMLQVLDDGRLTDSSGRTVDFKNTVIIMTSNVGAQEILQEGVGTDFAKRSYQDARIQALVTRKLQENFRPEFLNRLDEIIIFKRLNKNDIRVIAEKMISEVRERALLKGINLKVTRAFKNMLIDDGFDPNYGARPLKRAIRRLIEDNLSTSLLSGKIGHGSQVLMHHDSLLNPKVLNAV